MGSIHLTYWSPLFWIVDFVQLRLPKPQRLFHPNAQGQLTVHE